MSTAEQGGNEHASIPAQRAANEATAKRFGLQIGETIELQDVSGSMVFRTRQMQRLLQLVESGKVGALICKELSRATRASDDFTDMVLFRALAEGGTLLYTESGPLDASTSQGNLLLRLQGWMAGDELQKIRSRVFASKEVKRRNGECPGSSITLPYGVAYDRPNRRWSYKPAEAALVRRAFQRFAAGEQNYVLLARLLNVTPRGMRLILGNPIYMGWRVIDTKRDPTPGGRRTTEDGRQASRVKVARNASEVIRVKVIDPPLISQELFDRVQRAMAEKRRHHWRGRPEAGRKFTYNGHLRCGLCDDLVYTVTKNDGRGYWYACKQKLAGKCEAPYQRRDVLEATLDDVFTNRLTDRRFLERIAAECERQSVDGGQQAHVAGLEAEVSRLEGKRRRILDGYFEGIIGKPECDLRVGEVDRSLSSLREVLTTEQPAVKVDVEQLQAVFQPFAEWAFLSREQKRTLLRAAGIIIRAANCKISGLYLNSLAGNYQDTPSDRGSWRPPA